MAMALPDCTDDTVSEMGQESCCQAISGADALTHSIDDHACRVDEVDPGRVRADLGSEFTFTIGRPHRQSVHRGNTAADLEEKAVAHQMYAKAPFV